MSKKNIAIVVGGGPAPGINGVIAAAVIHGVNRGHKVYGIRTGFQRIAQGDKSCVEELKISDVSAIHKEGGSVLGTSRANPRKSPEMLQRVVQVLEDFNVGYLVTIGGDDTASSARAISETACGRISVAHVPKTIDNDLPLPEMHATFGYESAREVGTEIVETLMVDAKTTGRWYLAITMGRKAGHLALGIGVSSSATLSIIPEEFPEGNVKLSAIVDIIVGSMLKRLSEGRPYGVVVLAEGLAEILDHNSIPELAEAERDPHGNIRFAEVDFGILMKRAVKARLREFGINDLLVVDKNIGYELRCRPANSFDQEYTRELGWGAVDFLVNGGNNAMIIREGDRMRPVSFDEFIDSETGRAKIRMVNIDSVHYHIAREYQIRLDKSDMENQDTLERISQVTNKSPEEIKKQFSF